MILSYLFVLFEPEFIVKAVKRKVLLNTMTKYIISGADKA